MLFRKKYANDGHFLVDILDCGRNECVYLLESTADGKAIVHNVPNDGCKVRFLSFGRFIQKKNIRIDDWEFRVSYSSITDVLCSESYPLAAASHCHPWFLKEWMLHMIVSWFEETAVLRNDLKVCFKKSALVYFQAIINSLPSLKWSSDAVFPGKLWSYYKRNICFYYVVDVDQF